MSEDKNLRYVNNSKILYQKATNKKWK